MPIGRLTRSAWMPFDAHRWCHGLMNMKDAVTSTREGSFPGTGQPASNPHQTPAERASAGRAARAEVPRSVHGEWQPAPDRADPVGLLEEQGTSRVQELVPLRYGRMLVSPFTFYRGAAYLMAADLAGAPRTGPDGPAVRRRAPVELRVVRGTGPAARLQPQRLRRVLAWPVRVGRQATGGELRGRGARPRVRRRRARGGQPGSRVVVPGGHAGPGPDAQARRLVRPLGRRRARRRAELAGQGQAAQALPQERCQGPVEGQHEGLLQAGRGRGWTSAADQRPSDDRQDPGADAATRSTTRSRTRLHAILHTYRRTLPGDHRHLLEGFRFADAARKVVGVGSVGTRAWIVLLVGNDDQDPLFLQAKEAQASVLEPFLGKSAYASHGQRVVEGPATDAVRERRDARLGADQRHRRRGTGLLRPAAVGRQGIGDRGGDEPAAMTAYARLCGWTLARAHARSGDPVAIAGYLGSGDQFDRALATFAEVLRRPERAGLRSAATCGRRRTRHGRERLSDWHAHPVIGRTRWLPLFVTQRGETSLRPWPLALARPRPRTGRQVGRFSGANDLADSQPTGWPTPAVPSTAEQPDNQQPLQQLNARALLASHPPRPFRS